MGHMSCHPTSSVKATQSSDKNQRITHSPRPCLIHLLPREATWHPLHLLSDRQTEPCYFVCNNRLQCCLIIIVAATLDIRVLVKKPAVKHRSPFVLHRTTDKKHWMKNLWQCRLALLLLPVYATIFSRYRDSNSSSKSSKWNCRIC